MRGAASGGAIAGTSGFEGARGPGAAPTGGRAIGAAGGSPPAVGGARGPGIVPTVRNGVRVGSPGGAMGNSPVRGGALGGAGVAGIPGLLTVRGVVGVGAGPGAAIPNAGSVVARDPLAGELMGRPAAAAASISRSRGISVAGVAPGATGARGAAVDGPGAGDRAGRAALVAGAPPDAAAAGATGLKDCGTLRRNCGSVA